MLLLFQGRLPAEDLFPYPASTRAEVRAVERVLAALSRYLQRREDPSGARMEGPRARRTLQTLAGGGALGLVAPEEHGGLGFSRRGQCLFLAQVAASCPSTAVALAAHQTLGMAGILRHARSPALEGWVRAMAAGSMVGALASAEPGGDPDAAAVHARAEPLPGGEGFVLNGRKARVLNAGPAQLFTVLARMHGTAAGGSGLSAFVVPRDAEGLRVGREAFRPGLKDCSLAEVHLEDVRVPPHHLLGGEGEGLAVVRHALASFRTALASVSLGLGRRCVAAAGRIAAERRCAGRPAAQWGPARVWMGRMARTLHAMECVVECTAGLEDAGRAGPLEGAMAQAFCTEGLVSMGLLLLRLAGGAGDAAEERATGLLAEVHTLAALQEHGTGLAAAAAAEGVAASWRKGCGRGGARRLLRLAGSAAWLRRLRGAVLLPEERRALPVPALASRMGRLAVACRQLGGEVEAMLRRLGPAADQALVELACMGGEAARLWGACAVLSRTAARMGSPGLPEAEEDLVLLDGLLSAPAGAAAGRAARVRQEEEWTSRFEALQGEGRCAAAADASGPAS